MTVIRLFYTFLKTGMRPKSTLYTSGTNALPICWISSSNCYINHEQSDNTLLGFSSETMLKCLVILWNAVAADLHTPLRHTGAPLHGHGSMGSSHQKLRNLFLYQGLLARYEVEVAVTGSDTGACFIIYPFNWIFIHKIHSIPWSEKLWLTWEAPCCDLQCAVYSLHISTLAPQSWCPAPVLC